MKKSSYIFMIVFALLIVARALSQSVKTQSDVIAPGQKIIVTYSGFPQGNDGWISIVSKAKDNDGYIMGYAYTYGQEAGKMVFDPIEYALAPGDYEVRGYCSAGYAICAQYAFHIGNADKVMVSTKKNIDVDEKIVVDFSGFEGNSKDWIGIAEENSADNKFLKYVYTDGKQNGQVTFDPLKPGSYELRGYFNNDYKVRARFKFSIGNTNTKARVKPQKDEFREGEPIMIDFSGFPGNEYDWIGVAKSGTNTINYLEYKYTNKKYQGSLTFKSLPLGKYEVRGYFNNSYVVEAKDTFWVGEPMDPRVVARKLVYAPDEDIVIDFAGFPGTNDWISIAKKGSSEIKYLQYKYTNEKQSGSLSFSKLPVGEYEARGYTDWDTHADTKWVVHARTEFKVGNEDPAIRLITKPFYWSSEKITVEFSGFPGTDADYVTISKDDQELQRETTRSRQSGNLVFDNLPAGTYELKAFSNNEPDAKQIVYIIVIDKFMDAYPEKLTYSENEYVKIKIENFPNDKNYHIDIKRIDTEKITPITSISGRGNSAVENRFRKGRYTVEAYLYGDDQRKSYHEFFVGESGSLKISASEPNFKAGERIGVDVENYSGSTRTYMAIAPSGVLNGGNIRYYNFSANSSSFHVGFDGMPAGLYEVRLYSFDKIVARTSIHVSE